MTPSTAPFQLPAIGAVRPALRDRSVSMVPSHVAVKRKSITEDASATKRQKVRGGKAVAFKQSAMPDEHELDLLTRAIQGLREEVSHFSNPPPCHL